MTARSLTLSPMVSRPRNDPFVAPHYARRVFRFFPPPDRPGASRRWAVLGLEAARRSAQL